MHFAVVQIALPSRSWWATRRTFDPPSPLCRHPVPMVIRIQRHPIDTAAAQRAGLLPLLLGSVMAALAQRLQIALVKKPLGVAAVRDDMIDDGGPRHAGQLGAQRTQRMVKQLPVPQLVPALAVVERFGLRVGHE